VHLPLKTTGGGEQRGGNGGSASKVLWTLLLKNEPRLKKNLLKRKLIQGSPWAKSEKMERCSWNSLGEGQGVVNTNPNHLQVIEKGRS